MHVKLIRLLGDFKLVQIGSHVYEPDYAWLFVSKCHPY